MLVDNDADDDPYLMLQPAWPKMRQELFCQSWELPQEARSPGDDLYDHHVYDVYDLYDHHVYDGLEGLQGWFT